MAENTYDVIVIGSGPGGYVAAIRASQLGFKVACVEKRATLGGTCLNVGCIPSKALLHNSHLFHEAKDGMAAHGVKISGVELDLPAMMKNKDEVVGQNTRGVEFLFKKNKIDWLKGTARILGAGKVAVTGTDDAGVVEYACKHIIIASGSEVMPLPGVEIDEKRIVSSTGGIALPEVPKHLVVIGGGYIGLELGAVWKRLGSEVTVVEYLDTILPNMDAEVAKQMDRLLRKQGFKFKLGFKVTGAKTSKKGVTLTVEPAKGGPAETIEADYVLASIGRRAFTDGLGLKDAGVAVDERGRVVTDAKYATNVPGIWAIGDCIVGPMLAHKASDEGVAVAEIIAGQAGKVNYEAIPGVVYTFPEVATVGKTEEELKKAGIAYKVGKFPMTANSRARAMGASDGLVKVLADATTDRVLGVHIMAAEAGTMIAEAVAVMEYGGSSEDIARTCHAHPTLNEAVREAAHAVTGHAIHI